MRATAQDYAEDFATHILQQYSLELLSVHTCAGMRDVIDAIWREHLDYVVRLEELGINTARLKRTMLATANEIIHRNRGQGHPNYYREAYVFLRRAVVAALETIAVMQRFQRRNADALSKCAHAEYAGREINVKIVTMYRDEFKAAEAALKK